MPGAGVAGSLAALQSVEDPGNRSCTDFPSWQDFDGNGCARYAEGKWAYTCVQEGVLSNSDRFASRRDETSLELTVLEACCICGGGEPTARALAVDRLAAVLWPVVEAVGANPPGGMPNATAALLVEAAQQGQDALKLRLAGLPSRQLLDFGLQMTGLPAEQIITGGAPWPAKLSEMLAELPPGRDANATGQRADPGGAALSVPQSRPQAEDVAALSKWAPMQEMANNAKLGALAAGTVAYRALMCAWHMLGVLLLIYGLLSTYTWVSQRYFSTRVYVLLRFHADFFGPGREVGNHCPNWMMASGAHGLYAFFLPSPREYPQRLAEFAASLVKDPETGVCNAWPTDEKGEWAAQIGTG